MPLVYSRDLSTDTRLGLWHIAEDEHFFNGMAAHSREIKHPHKRLQHLAGRHLLTVLFPDFPLSEIKMGVTRKPFVATDNWHFTISHCGDYVAALISRSHPCGIDIEEPKEKIIALSQKFFNQREDEMQQGYSIPQALYATIIWCIKEAVFKWYGLGGVDFAGDIQVTQLWINEDLCMAKVFIKKEMNKELLVQGVLFEDLVLMWVVSQF